MKGVLLCVLLGIYCQTVFAESSPTTYLDTIERQCGYKTKEIQVIYDENGYLIEDNEDINELVRCNWVEQGLVNQNRIDLYRLQRMLEHNLIGEYENYVRTYLASKTLTDCRDIQAKTIGDASVKMYNCIIRRLKANKHLLHEESDSE